MMMAVVMMTMMTMVMMVMHFRLEHIEVEVYLRLELCHFPVTHWVFETTDSNPEQQIIFRFSDKDSRGGRGHGAAPLVHSTFYLFVKSLIQNYIMP